MNEQTDHASVWEGTIVRNSVFSSSANTTTTFGDYEKDEKMPLYINIVILGVESLLI